MRTGELVKTEILSLAYGGSGVAKVGAMVLFVPLAAPGDRALVEITEVRNNFSRGRIKEIQIPSPERVEPRCDSYGICGGCHYQHLPYQNQLHWKKTQITDILERIGGLQKGAPITVVPSPDSYNYRGKVEMHVAREADGPLRLGFHERGSNRLVEIDRCEIAHTSINLALGELREQIHARTIASLPKKIVLWSRPGGKALVILQPQGQVERPVKGRFVKVPSFGFFQANSLLIDRMVELVSELCRLTGEETIVDCHCGMGLFTLFLAPQARRVYGIESDPEALALARTNNMSGGAHGKAVFYLGDVGRILHEHFVRNRTSVDVMILDPPRPGLTKKAISGIAAVRPGRVVYVSCNPATLARDLRSLTAAGYGLLSLHLLDMFPQTGHIETVALLERSTAL